MVWIVERWKKRNLLRYGLDLLIDGKKKSFQKMVWTLIEGKKKPFQIWFELLNDGKRNLFRNGLDVDTWKIKENSLISIQNLMIVWMLI